MKPTRGDASEHARSAEARLPRGLPSGEVTPGPLAGPRSTPVAVARAARAAVGALAALGAPSLALAADATHVLTAAEPDAPLPEVALGARFDRAHESGRITREGFDPDAGTAVELDELDFEATTYTLTIEGRVGLYHDLELTVGAPIVLEHASRVDFAPGAAERSSVYAPAPSADAPTRADDPDFAGRFPLTEVPSSRTRAGFGDLRLGLGWSPVVDEKDEGWPTITLRGEVTVPTGEVWDPADPRALPGGPGGSVGRGLTVVDLSLGLSKRARAGAPTLDPYVVFGARLPFANAEQADRGMEPPASGRLRAGAEVVLHEVPEDRVRYALDLGVGLRYVASGRTYGPLSDYLPSFDPTRVGGETIAYDDYADPAHYRSSGVEGVSCSGVRLDRRTGALVPATPGVPCGELNQIADHVEMGGQLALHLRPTRFTLLRAGVELTWTSPHFITGEQVGEDRDPPGTTATCGASPCAGRVNARNSLGEDERSPWYDPRYDAPGGRFRFQDALRFTVRVEAVATF